MSNMHRAFLMQIVGITIVIGLGVILWRLLPSTPTTDFMCRDGLSCPANYWTVDVKEKDGLIKTGCVKMKVPR